MNSHLLGAMPGHCFSRRLQREYELMSFISDGTYGEVWKAVRKVPGRSFACRCRCQHDYCHSNTNSNRLMSLDLTNPRVHSRSCSTRIRLQIPFLSVTVARMRLSIRFTLSRNSKHCLPKPLPIRPKKFLQATPQTRMLRNRCSAFQWRHCAR